MLERLSLTSEQYFALPYASNSGVKEAHALMRAKDQDRNHVPAYAFGTALDAMLTDPDTMDSSRLTPEEQKMINPMRRAIERNEIYAALFKDSERQTVFVDKEFAVSFDGLNVTIPVKCKYDWWNPLPYLNFGGDLKTTMANTQRAFISAANWFDYDQQAAWYMDITGSDRFVIIAVSKDNYATFVKNYKRDSDEYKSGKAKYLRCAASWWKLYGISA